MITTPNNPNAVTIPAGTQTTSTWDDEEGYRIVWSDSRQVDGTPLLPSTCVVQLPDGRIDVNGDVGDVGDAPSILTDELRDGQSWEKLTVTVEGARALAQALLATADEIDGNHPRESCVVLGVGPSPLAGSGPLYSCELLQRSDARRNPLRTSLNDGLARSNGRRRGAWGSARGALPLSIESADCIGVPDGATTQVGQRRREVWRMA